MYMYIPWQHACAHFTVYIMCFSQAIGDGGQGWGNAILYVFLSPTIREKLCNALCGNCMDALEGRLGVLLDSETAGSRNVQDKMTDNGTTRNIVTLANDRQAPLDTTPLISTAPATGYGIKEYNTTTSGTHSDNRDLLSSTVT